METTRQNKIARLIQKELSEIFLLQTKSMPGVLGSAGFGQHCPHQSRYELCACIFERLPFGEK